MSCRACFAALLLLAVSCSPFGSSDPPGILVRVGYVAMDPRAGAPVVVLEDQIGGRKLPIWIGLAEAQSIASQMEHVTLPRPNTHDLAKRVLDQLESRVERVVVTELREGTYYAMLVLSSSGRRLEIDARPSDAIALALRFEAPVYVHESLFGVSGGTPGTEAFERSAERLHGLTALRVGNTPATRASERRFPQGKRSSATPTAGRPG